MSRAARLLAAAAGVALASAASAQSPAEFLPAPPAETIPDVAPPEATPPRPLAPEPAAGPSFVLRGVRLEGATALSADELAPLWANLLGTSVSLDGLDAIAASVTAAYRARGHLLSQAVLPPQTVTDGVVTVRVVEGFVDRIAVTGGAPNQREAAARLFAPVGADAPLRLTTLERSVLLARDLFGGGVETVVEPSPDTFAAADLTVVLPSAPVAGFASLDNRGSRLYGAWSFVTGVTARNLLQRNETLGIVGAGAADGSLGYVQGTASLPLFALAGTRLDGATLELQADYANGEPDLAKSGAPDAQTLTTHEISLRAGVRIPFVRTRVQNLFGEFALDWRDADNVTGFGPTEITETDRLLALDASLSWDRADRVGGVTLVAAGVRQGLDPGGAVSGDGVSSGEADFTLATLDVARLQRLGDAPWSLWIEFTGQWTNDVLPNSERFSLGDSSIGRGFAPGSATGDAGFGGRVELRRQVGGAVLGGLAEAAELYAFGDYGRAFDRDGDRDGARRETLASAGIGARIDVKPWLTFTPELTRQIEGRSSDTTDEDPETRLFVGFVTRF